MSTQRRGVRRSAGFGPVSLWVLLAALSGCGDSAPSGTPGVFEDRIVLGTHQPLDGPVAFHGQHMLNGLRMRVEDINAAGGIHGRSIELIAENNSYDQQKAMQAGEKLLVRDRVFALIGALGTPMNMVTMPRALEAGVPNLFPASFSRKMYEPHHPLKFAYLTPYYDQMRAAVQHFVGEQGCQRVGVLYQDDDYGLDALEGVVDQLAELGLEAVETVRYRRGDREFRTQVARLQDAECDLVILATVILETVSVMGEARGRGFTPTFCVTSAGFSQQVIDLAEGECEGLFVTTHTPMPYRDEAEEELRQWVDRYRETFSMDPDLGAFNGWVAMDLFAVAAERAGRDLSAPGLARAIESIEGYTDLFGGPELTFSSERHLGADPRQGVVLCQLEGDRWKIRQRISY